MSPCPTSAVQTRSLVVRHFRSGASGLTDQGTSELVAPAAGIFPSLNGFAMEPGGKALAVRVDAPDAAVLREMAEKLRDKLGEAVVLVGSVAGPKAMIALAVSKGLTDRYKAGDLIKPVAQVLGGSGGGRPDMAQAGGTQVDKLDEALEKLYAIVA